MPCAISNRVVERPEGLEHAQAVVINVYARAGRAQPVGTLMHAHPPAALRERAGRGQPRESPSDDLSPARVSQGHIPAAIVVPPFWSQA